MALKIRLMRRGTKQSPHHKIVVIEDSKARNSDFIEELGFYNPVFNPPLIKINQERVNYWIKMGAKPTKTLESLLKRA